MGFRGRVGGDSAGGNNFAFDIDGSVAIGDIVIDDFVNSVSYPNAIQNFEAAVTDITLTDSVSDLNVILDLNANVLTLAITDVSFQIPGGSEGELTAVTLNYDLDRNQQNQLEDNLTNLDFLINFLFDNFNEDGPGSNEDSVIVYDSAIENYVRSFDENRIDDTDDNSDGNSTNDWQSDGFRALGLREMPTANNDAYRTIANVQLNVTPLGVLENDIDDDGNTLTALLVNQASNGSVVLNPNGSFSYTPNNNFQGQDAFTYQAQSTDNNGIVMFSDVATVTVDVEQNPTNPVSPLNTPIYRFQNTNLPGTYLFVGEQERQNILANFPNFVEEGQAFRVGVQPGDNLIALNRFQNSSIPGTYLYAGEQESIGIRANFPNFIEEGVAFYVYPGSANLGVDFNRFQNTNLPGTFLYAGEQESIGIRANFPNFVEEGVAFEVAV